MPKAASHVSLVNDLPLQPASEDIWDSKYRLRSKDGVILDQTVDDTYKRVAKALAQIEPVNQRMWEKTFLWALRAGAIPAGRILANAGAHEHKPNTSLINCTISGTIEDSMHGILQKVYEAGMTLAPGCGIGYDFSTLRPRGSFVAGVGAKTSGAISFMTIYDSMCFTVASAGGRRGAQMGTMMITHPSIREFIQAKRQNGMLRQFNLSVLLTEEFMRALENNTEIALWFPHNKKESQEGKEFVYHKWPYFDDSMVLGPDGTVMCKVYERVPAGELWELIMRSTYDYAEPGCLFVDNINRENNLWFCEDIRATNPCFHKDTFIHTREGEFSIHSLIGKTVEVWDGTQYVLVDNFRVTGTNQDTVKVTLQDGSEIIVTPEHSFYLESGTKLMAKDLLPGHRLAIANAPVSEGTIETTGAYIKGFLLGDGTSLESKLTLWVYEPKYGCQDRLLASAAEVSAKTVRTNGIAELGFVQVSKRKAVQMTGLSTRAYELRPWANEFKKGLPAEVMAWKREHKLQLIAGLFDADGGAMDTSHGYGYQLWNVSRQFLLDLQCLLKSLGVFSNLSLGKLAENTDFNDGYGVYHSQVSWRLTIAQSSAIRLSGMVKFARLIAFSDRKTTYRLKPRFNTVVKIEAAKNEQAVYCCTVPTNHKVALSNGVISGQCGEQPMPPYGSCLLGSINLTKFVMHPFTEMARFDFNAFKEVVHVFTRMLDNVVEINGLPLPQQREEIMRKRRHGMGFCGLGSALAMLGIRYGSKEAAVVAQAIAQMLAIGGWEEGILLAKEKGPAPIMSALFTDKETGKEKPGRELLLQSEYMQRLVAAAPSLGVIREHGARFSHHTSIAPTGTMSASVCNNVSNGIEPSFAHRYKRNIIKEGRSTKEQVNVYSYEFLLFCHHNALDPDSDDALKNLPDYFVTTDDLSPEEHIRMQAAVQPWIDSAISKTINVPTDIKFEDFTDIYRRAWQENLKGCATFRFNPEAFSGVLVKAEDLAATKYTFKLANGESLTVSGNEEIEYNGEVHVAVNLFDAIKEGYFGRL